jgi:hypothetical protein
VALFKCSSCGHILADTALRCPGCGTPGPIARHPNNWRTAEPESALSAMRAATESVAQPAATVSSQRTSILIKFLAFISRKIRERWARLNHRQRVREVATYAVGSFLLIGLLAALTQDNPKQERSIHTPAASPAATTLDGEPPEKQLAIIDYGSVAADDIRVSRFRALLDELSESYSSSRQQITDQTVKCQEILHDKGIKESLINIMEGMNKLFASSTHKQEYSQWLAAYIVLREKSMSHDEAIRGLDGIGQALGG